MTMTGQKEPPASLFALGKAGLPAKFTQNGVDYAMVHPFKHDFFAATGLYAQCDRPEHLVVLKIHRTTSYYGLPLHWACRRFARHEAKLNEALQDIRGIPGYLGMYGTHGFVHEFIPGRPLEGDMKLGPEFFADLYRLFADLHSRHVAYVDSNKRENILMGEDGRPYLIDFQISWHNAKGPRQNFLARWLLKRLQTEDWYHFYKHKTRLAPTLCTPEEMLRGTRQSWYIKLHRAIAQPIIHTRRKFLARYKLDRTK
jgi:hypothetical protein